MSNLAVRADARRQGVGARLAWEACTIARDAAARRIELDVYTFNAEARAFYARLGFEAQVERLALDPSSSALHR